MKTDFWAKIDHCPQNSTTKVTLILSHTLGLWGILFQQQGFLMFWRSLWNQSISSVTFWSRKNLLQSAVTEAIFCLIWWYLKFPAQIDLVYCNFFRSCHGYRHISKLLCEITVHKLFYVKKKKVCGQRLDFHQSLEIWQFAGNKSVRASCT